MLANIAPEAPDQLVSIILLRSIRRLGMHYRASGKCIKVE